MKKIILDPTPKKTKPIKKTPKRAFKVTSPWRTQQTKFSPPEYRLEMVNDALSPVVEAE
jgi:hypothetical protein